MIGVERRGGGWVGCRDVVSQGRLIVDCAWSGSFLCETGKYVCLLPCSEYDLLEYVLELSLE